MATRKGKKQAEQARPRRAFGKSPRFVADVEIGDGVYPVLSMMKLDGEDLIRHDDAAETVVAAQRSDEGHRAVIKVEPSVVDLITILVPDAPREEIEALPFMEKMSLLSYVRGGYRKRDQSDPLDALLGDPDGGR